MARAHGIRVVLASLLPVSDYEKTADGQVRNQTTRRPPEQIKALNEWMKKYSAENKMTYLDYYSAMVDDKGFLKDELSNDGLHPNVQGYQEMANAAADARHRSTGRPVCASRDTCGAARRHRRDTTAKRGSGLPRPRRVRHGGSDIAPFCPIVVVSDWQSRGQDAPR